MKKPSEPQPSPGAPSSGPRPAAPGRSIPQAAPARPIPQAAPARQRWRLYVAQPAASEAERRTEGGAPGWATILAPAGLPFARDGGTRIRVSQAASLPPGIAGEREVVDVYLADRRTVAQVREEVAGVLPPGWLLVDLHDVWVGAPTPAASVVAADYRVFVAGETRWALEGAALALLAAESLPRERRREKRTTAYDLRPLLLDLRVRSGGGEGMTLGMRLRHAPDGVGRPEDVVAALGEPPASPAPSPLVVRSVVRERLVMAGDPDAPASGSAGRGSPTTKG